MLELGVNKIIAITPNGFTITDLPLILCFISVL